MLPLSIAYALSAAAVAMAALCAAAPIVRLLARAWDRASGVARGVFLVASAGACLYGGAKHIVGHVTYPYTDPEVRYLVDAGSYVTNDYVHVAFTKSLLVPNSADFLGYVRPAGSTNDAEWAQMLETTFAAFSSPSNVPYIGAISNDFQFFTTWTPGPQAHTNGVAMIVWQQPFVGSTNRIATIRTGIYLNGTRLAPNPLITNSPPIIIQATLNGDSTDE